MLPKVQVMVSELITKPKPAPAAQALGWWAVNSEIMTKKTQKTLLYRYSGYFLI